MLNDRYFNTEGYRSLRSFTQPIDLAQYDAFKWETTQVQRTTLNPYCFVS
jgi:hypothetical protein